MKRAGIIAAAALLAATAAGGAEQPLHEACRQGTITVTGSVTEEFSPDTAILVLAVETQKETAQEAAKENAEKIDRVVAVLKGLVEAAAGDSIATSAYSVQQTFEYDDKLRRNRPTGYRTFNQVTVKTSRVSAVGEMIDRAIKNGANSVTDIRFAIRDNRKQCERLLVKASQQAREMAETVARSLEVRLSGIRHAAPSCGGEQRPQPLFRAMASSKMTDAGEPATAIEAGALALTGQVQVEFTLAK